MATTTRTTISTIRTVAIPASDQDRTVAFFEDLGFTKQLDEELQEGFPVSYTHLTLPTILRV